MKFTVSRAVMIICIVPLVASTLTYATNTAQADIGKIYFISAAGACNDGIDNDGDGWTDSQDVILDCPIAPPAPTGQREICGDGIDNDGDGWADYQDFLDCPIAPPAPTGQREICGDAIDNEGDGYADRWDLGDCQVCYLSQTCPAGNVNPGDPSPIGPWDTHGFILSETCSNGVDNDGDAIIDEGCRRGIWPPLLEYCGDNFDNNYDGRVDEPVDEDGVPCRPF